MPNVPQTNTYETINYNMFQYGFSDPTGGGSAPVKEAKVAKTAPQTIPDATTIYLTFESEEYDTDSFHDTVTNNTRLTIPENGTYLVLGQVEFAPDNTADRLACIQKNGSINLGLVRQPSITNAGTSQRIQVVAHAPLIAGDYVELRAFQNTGGNLDVLTPGTFFSIVKL